MNLTRDDRKWLRTVEISPHDVCPTCSGFGCVDCRDTGVLVLHRTQCQGDGCDCADTSHAPRQDVTDEH